MKRTNINPATIDSLEPRQFLTADYAVLVGSTLMVTGTAGNDVADIIERRGKIRVHMNDPAVVMQFPRASVALAIVQLGDGNDHFVMDAALVLDVKVFGGAGNDAIGTSLGNDRIEGGDGNDSLVGGGGDDRLYGQAGDDLIYGQSGRDFIFGGEGADTAFAESRDRTVDSIEILR